MRYVIEKDVSFLKHWDLYSESGDVVREAPDSEEVRAAERRRTHDLERIRAFVNSTHPETCVNVLFQAYEKIEGMV